MARNGIPKVLLRISEFKKNVVTCDNTVELHLFGIIVTASHPDMQKIRMIGFFFENRLHWQFEVRLLLFTVCTCVWTFRPRLVWSSI